MNYLASTNRTLPSLSASFHAVRLGKSITIAISALVITVLFCAITPVTAHAFSLGPKDWYELDQYHGDVLIGDDYYSYDQSESGKTVYIYKNDKKICSYKTSYWDGGACVLTNGKFAIFYVDRTTAHWSYAKAQLVSLKTKKKTTLCNIKDKRFRGIAVYDNKMYFTIIKSSVDKPTNCTYSMKISKGAKPKKILTGYQPSSTFCSKYLPIFKTTKNYSPDAPFYIYNVKTGKKHKIGNAAAACPTGITQIEDRWYFTNRKTIGSWHKVAFKYCKLDGTGKNTLATITVPKSKKLIVEYLTASSACYSLNCSKYYEYTYRTGKSKRCADPYAG